jgi:Ca2+/Na+ antiporter
MQRLFTRQWIGISLIILFFIFSEYFFIKFGFQKGFTIGAIFYQIVLAIVIACIIASPLILEKSFIATMTGIYILILFFIAIALVTIVNASGDWGGSVTFLFIFLLFFYYILRELAMYKQEPEPRENQIPSDDSRYIPSEVKLAVWARDRGRCVLCGSKQQLHYDHDIPFSKGGSNTEQNIRILCQDCNLRKSDKIE